jgi:hypothetical protein
MTEQEWLSTREVGDMESLLFDTNRFSKRKMRLVSLEACKHILHLLPDANCISVFEWAAQYSDGLVGEQGFLALSRHFATATGERDSAATEAAIRAVLALGPAEAPDAATAQVVDAKGIEAMVRAGCISPTLTSTEVSQVIQDARGSPVHEVFTRACEAEELAIANVVREIFGNPFRPVTIEPAWQTATVVSIGQAMYDERAFDRMAILADALEDAGCIDAELLAHCRGPGPHVRGCWVLDLLLGKE